MLQKTTTNQAATATDIHQQQVLDNLAKFAFDSNSMPSFSIASSGQATVGDSVSGGLTQLGFDPFGFVGASLNLGGSRGTTNFWSLTAVNDPRRLELMRCAYQRAVTESIDKESVACPGCEKRFNAFYTGRPQGVDDFEFREKGKKVVPDRKSPAKPDAKELTLVRPTIIGNAVPAPGSPEDDGSVTINCINPGYCRWFGVGPKESVPKDCPCQYVGHYCGTYVWVLPGEGRDELSKLTLAILDFAINDFASLPTKEVVLYRRVDPDGVERPADSATATKVITVTVPMDDLAEAHLAYPPDWQQIWPKPESKAAPSWSSPLKQLFSANENAAPEAVAPANESTVNVASEPLPPLRQQSPPVFLQGDGLTRERIMIDRFAPPGSTR